MVACEPTVPGTANSTEGIVSVVTGTDDNATSMAMAAVPGTVGSQATILDGHPRANNSGAAKRRTRGFKTGMSSPRMAAPITPPSNDEV